MTKNQFYTGIVLLIFHSHFYAQSSDFIEERNCKQHQLFEMFNEENFQKKEETLIIVHSEMNAYWRWIQNIDIILMERMYNFACASTPIGFFEELILKGKSF